MDEYDKKFAEMQKYIPFLEAMIERLQNVKDKSREVQLQKMQGLHGILSNSKRKLKIETLQRCEDVLQKLHNKVEKGNTPGLHFSNKKGEPNTGQCSTATEDALAQVDHTKFIAKCQEEPTDGEDLNETPASPSPPVSPDSGPETRPIIIPTERSVDFADKSDSKPASPDISETLPTKAPIIIPTERKNVDDLSFTEWDMLEECENQSSRKKSGWSAVVPSAHDAATAVKLAGSNLPAKASDGRPQVPIVPRHIPTVPVPSLGGSRRLSSVLEKNRLTGVNLEILSPDISPESPGSASDRLKSPDSDILFPKRKSTSPRLKDGHGVLKPVPKPSAPLLLSPPPVSTEPPLSMEDLAELLNEEDDGKTEKTDRSTEDATKFKKDIGKPEPNTVAVNSKEAKGSKPFLLTQEDIDRENERRWEEVDKHIVKLTSRKYFPSPTVNAKIDPLKSSEIKGPPVHGPFPPNADKSAEGRVPPSSPSSKIEPRYADNYERHPRQSRDSYSHDKDKGNPAHSRPTDDELINPIPVFHSGQPEDRNPAPYQRRQSNAVEVLPPRIDTEFRMEGPDYYNRHMPNPGHWTPMHPPVNKEFCNNQWAPPANFPGMPNPPAQPYQHPGMHQEMWNVPGPGNPMHMDPHQINDPLRPNQFPQTLGTNIRPLMSPTSRPPDLAHNQRPDDIANVPAKQPMISPTNFPVGPQYRNFQGENRPYEQSFDRGMEYPHVRQSWDSQAARPNEYRPEGEGPCGMGPEGPTGLYPRPSTPCPWPRDRDRCNRGRGRETYYSDRGRGETRSNFTREPRRPEWSRENSSHSEWDSCNRFRERNLSERDPRVRTEHGAQGQSSAPARDAGASVRDPRLAKDKHQPAPKAKDALFNERDPRKRSVPAAVVTSPRKSKDKSKSPKSSDSQRRADSEKHCTEKTGKEKMQSPLESLYGVIDTKAKTAQGYCLQNFKIPKIKRSEPSESPTSSHAAPEKQDGKSHRGPESQDDGQNAAEVSSSSDGNIFLEDWNGTYVPPESEGPKAQDAAPEAVEDSGKCELKVGEADSISTTLPKSAEEADKSKKDEGEPGPVKSKEEVTQEWIESLIRKSFEFGEGKKFVEQAKLMQKLGAVLQAKKLKKIKKIIESETESSSSDKDEPVDVKKTPIRKKRRVIVSDSSDEECLAERLGTLNTAKDEEPPAADDKKDADAEVAAATSSKNETVQETSSHQHQPEDVAKDTFDVFREKSPAKDPITDVAEQASDRSQEAADDKESGTRTPRAKAKRRNSLEMLQEDIREMFISEGVVTATGHRMCRLQKESQQSAGSPPVKKDDASTKRDADSNSDTEESLANLPSKKTVKAPGTGDLAKVKAKTKKETQRVTRRRSKKSRVIRSSDSEEDQPLAFRTEIVQKSGSLPVQDDGRGEESSELLRRSKRVLGKEMTKEPRVLVEKTDITKLDCAKVMFDSSSDESFGIDVSELAEAVDISLGPEKQNDAPDALETLKKTQEASSKKPSNKKRDGSVSDEGSVSDVSMSSSTAPKLNAGSSKIDTTGSEELLSNILVGIVPSKGDVAKSAGDKGSDADVDDDQSVSEQSAKKTLVRKKKKKCNWQMGILSKKKKKKAANPKPDNEPVNSSLEEAAAKPPETLENKLIDAPSETDLDKTLENVAEESDVVKTSGDATADDVPTEKIVNASTDPPSKSETVDEPSTDVKPPEENKSEKTETNVKTVAKKNLFENAKVNYDQLMDKTFSNLDTQRLIEYAWTGQERYKCLLCFFTGKNIVHHYKLNHPEKEILISRLRLADAQAALQEARNKTSDGKPVDASREEVCKFHCRFCYFFTEGSTRVAMEAFYEHCTTHTGEYRYRCNRCPYQAVAKSSMRTHYYKVCRKSSAYIENFEASITEDELPDERGICGYLCSICNYVQLKKSNLEKHFDLWHREESRDGIVKINLSLETADNSGYTLSKKLKDETSPSTEPPSTAAPGAEAVQEDVDVKEIKEDDDSCEIVGEKKGESNKAMLKDEGGSSKRRSQGEKIKSQEEEAALPTGKLSVFVCPPELEKKEVEIQLERKRKMQEIIENIGIKLQKDRCKKGLSIIDKLKDKMRTNLQMANYEKNESNAALESNKNSADVPAPSTTPQSETAESTTPADLLPVEEATNKSDDVPASEKETADSTATSEEAVEIECGPEVVDEGEKLEVNVRDPLTTVDQKKNDESEMETSDTENTGHSAPIYESDSSSEQSDTEPPADVNLLLKETSNINASSKDPMITTIQRLAAQLQAAKPLEESRDEKPSKPRKSGKLSAVSGIPKPPNVIPLSNIKRFKRLDARYHEILSDNCEDGGQQKNFIRLRRLSGDMLSVPVTSAGEEDSAVEGNDGSKSDTAEMQQDEEEGCSFLKIENVVSLAPTSDNSEPESPIINDIRKAVESPVKNKGVSLLKKYNSPYVLQRLNALTITQPMTTNLQTIQPVTSETVTLIPVKNLPPSASASSTQLTTSFIPIAPKSTIIQLDSFPLAVNKSTVITPVTTRTVSVASSSAAADVNYKILKVVRPSGGVKSAEYPGQASLAVKLKCPEAYTTMLKPAKLTQFYKCMARECAFTTDSVALYHQHYSQHAINAGKRKLAPPFGYQKCCYCYTVLEDWNKMKTHLEEKHAHCRYQCNFCFYRAAVPSYVKVHQAINHQGSHGILLGKLLKELPAKEEYNVHDYVHPFVCQHNCRKFFYVVEAFVAHLKIKHGPSVSIFKCHMCPSTYLKIDQLISHYKMHGYYKYQCLYCLNGSDTFNEMHNHLAIFHCNRLPQILERSLPPQPIRSKDVIDQLLIRTLDENFKSPDETIKVDGDGAVKESALKEFLNLGSPSPQKTAAPQLPKETTVVDKDDNEALDQSICSLSATIDGSAKNPSSSSVSLLQHGKVPSNENSGEKPSEAAASDSSTSAADKKSLEGNSSAGGVANASPVGSIKVTDLELPSHASNDGSSMDPFEFAGGFDYNDEFINMNLLDNPDFLRNASSRSNSTSLMNSAATANESKAEDSDIEILENVSTVSTATSSKTSDAKTSDAKTSDAKTNDDRFAKEKGKPDSGDRRISAGEQSISSSGPKTSGPSDGPTGNSNAGTQSRQFLTLEDVKDSGFTGVHLYKCGYENCNVNTKTAAALRNHARECIYRQENLNMNCVHCGKRFLKIGFLLEHLKVHGLKRFGCSLCTTRYAVGYQAIAHMKGKHKYSNSKLVPADPKNPAADGLFVVQPVTVTGERKGRKRKKPLEKENEKSMDIEKSSFSPDEIELLPRQAIYNREVQCAVCPYTTKVRTNIIRHLQLHAKDESVPESGPVNPVPCLDKKERMFDKMVNLASSSHQNGRMGGKSKEPVKDSDEEFIPKFVPEHKRYVCGVAECNYLTVDEAMLRYHLKALHSEEPYFRCPHCPQQQPGQEAQNIAIDKMGVHLKMHDTRLYKCSHCNHHHYHRHVVERHLADKHPEKRPFVKVIREVESTETAQQPVPEETEDEVPDPDGNHWKCNICEHKCVYKAEMASHANTVHDEKNQFKCTLCPFKTSGKIMFELHVTSKHSNDSNVDYVLVYQRIKGVNKKNTETVEQASQEEPFDTTPLWRRDMPRIRHIRGILLEEEGERPNAESSLKTAKRKSDAEIAAPKPAKIKPGKTGSLDDSRQLKEKSKRSLSCEKLPGETSSSTETLDAPARKGSAEAAAEKLYKEQSEQSDDSDGGKFGPFGKPDGIMYVCTLCVQFKSKYKHDMRDHLYRELNYARWHCKECGYLSVNRNALLKHFAKHHQGERPDHEPLSPDNEIETWVGTLLKKQTLLIKATLAKQNMTNANKSGPSTSVETSKVPVTQIVQSPVKETVKTVDLTHKLFNLQDPVVQNTDIDLNVNDDDSRDAALVIDIKEENPPKKIKTENVASAGKETGQGKPFICKHCNMMFTRWRGFKLHVKLTHLKLLGFLCPYCDRSTNSETLMRQHVRSKHANCVEKIIHNPAAGGPELSDEFWEKEYGIVCPKKSKKRKRQQSIEDVVPETDSSEQNDTEKCQVCGFTAVNLTGLRAHMRVHAARPTLKCTLCTFATNLKAELSEHWEVNHPFQPFQFDDFQASGSSGSAQQTDYSDDIEEEHVPVSNTKSELLYSCFYCPLRSKSLETVREHWSIAHKELKLANDPSKLKTNVPFRYKELYLSVPSPTKPKRLKKDAEHPYEMYVQQSQQDVPVIDITAANQQGWICQWCTELCDSEAKMKSHQNMFHSHLPFNFKKQGSDEAPKGYVCPECPFATTLINVMKIHVSKHINLFKCKYCEKTFSNPTQVSMHNAEEHPGLESKIESIPNFDVLVEKIMSQVKWHKSCAPAGPKKATGRHPVARKSTAKGGVLHVSPVHAKVKSVARKSTNPLSRYLTNFKSNEKNRFKDKFAITGQFSFYGVPRSPVNLARLNTYMVVGGHRMKVNCTTLAQLIDIDPKVVVKDLKHDAKNAAVVSKLKFVQN